MSRSHVWTIAHCLGAIVLGFIILYEKGGSVDKQYPDENTTVVSKDPVSLTGLSRDLSQFTYDEWKIYPPFDYHNSPYETQTYVECCAEPEETILDEFDDDMLWHLNTVHVGNLWPEPDGENILETIFGCRKNPCVIKRNPGGGIMEFALAGEAARRTGMFFIITGMCASACTLFADIARTQVCLGPRAKMGFHKWSAVRWASNGKYYWVANVRYFDPKYTPDLEGLVRAHGGYPQRSMNILAQKIAKKIWAPCDLNPPLPQPRPRQQ